MKKIKKLIFIKSRKIINLLYFYKLYFFYPMPFPFYFVNSVAVNIPGFFKDTDKYTSNYIIVSAKEK